MKWFFEKKNAFENTFSFWWLGFILAAPICICVIRRDYDMFSGKIRQRAPYFVWFCDGIDFGGTTNVLGSSIFLLIMILYILRKHVKAYWCCLSFQRRSIQRERHFSSCCKFVFHCAITPIADKKKESQFLAKGCHLF